MEIDKIVEARSAIKWDVMRELAAKIDGIYSSKTSWGETSSQEGGNGNSGSQEGGSSPEGTASVPGRGPSCYAKKTSSSYKSDGVPSLKEDITAPFKATRFDTDIKLHQRFEFVYFSTLGDTDLSESQDGDDYTDYCGQHSGDERPLVFSYIKYLTGKAYPILVSQFLVKDAAGYNKTETGGGSSTQSSESSGESSGGSTNYYGTTACAAALGTTAENVGNLIESHLDKINEWWPECNHKRREEPTISAELYFISTPGDSGSWRDRCPCGGVFRVAFASTAAPAHNGDAQTLCGATQSDGNAHAWKVNVPEDFDSESAGITADCLTLTQSDWGQLLPYSAEDPETVKLYQVPSSDCCPRAKFPKFGYQGGGCEHNMYGKGILLPNTSGSNGASYKEVWRGSYAEYTQKKAANGFNSGDLQHILPKDVTLYDNPAYASYSLWQDACGEGTGSAYVRTTRMVFFYTDNEDEYYDDMEAHKDKIKAVIVEVPTSVTVTIPGKFQPAIRKRWYDMMYHHIRLLSGYVVKNGSSVYPIGASWDSTVEYPCSNSALFDTMAAFLLTQDVGYPYYSACNGTKYSSSSDAANLKANCEAPSDGSMNQAWCVPFATVCPLDFSNTSALCNNNTGLTTYQASTEEYSGAVQPPEYFFGEPYMEQVLCRHNVPPNATRQDADIDCSGAGGGSWNAEKGCFCTKRISTEYQEEQAGETTGKDTECSGSGDSSSNEPYENPNPDSCTQAPASFPQLSQGQAAQDSYSPECTAVVCELNVPLPWDGGCGVDKCDCLTCGPGYNVYAASTNYLNAMISLLDSSKLKEGELTKVSDKWKVICRTGSEDSSKDAVSYALELPFPYTPPLWSCCDPGKSLVTHTVYPTKLEETHSCSDYISYADSTCTPESFCNGRPVDGLDTGITVDPRIGKSPIQLLAWCTYIVPTSDNDLKVKISISKEDMRKLLASYFVQGRHIDNNVAGDYICAISPVCGYINGSVYIGPYMQGHTPSMINPTDANFTMLPYDPTEYTDGIDTVNSWVNEGDKVKLLEGCTEGWDPRSKTINDTLINPDNDSEYYCEVPLKIASNGKNMPGHYRKVIVINMTIDHDGFGMHGGGPTSDYTPPSAGSDIVMDPRATATATQAIMCQLTPDITEAPDEVLWWGAQDSGGITVHKLQIKANKIPKYKTGSATINISITKDDNKQ